jgi:predicted enzyme related to lactoylglutathione lyase
MTRHGTIHWNELNTFAPDKARAFYESVLGWAFDAMPMEGGTYLVARQGEAMVAGIFDMKLAGLPETMPSHWLTYIAVDDVDARARQVEASGGKVLRAPWDVPGVGRVAIIQDAAGAGLGLITPAPQG